MNTIALLALGISLALWTAETTYGNANWPAFEQSQAENAAKPASNDSRGVERVAAEREKGQQVGSVATKKLKERRAPGKVPGRLVPSMVKTHPKPAPNSPAFFPAAKAVKPEPGSRSSGTTGVVAANAHKRLGGLSANATRLTARPVNNARHRGASPAVLGGPANSGSRNAAIDGTGMRRKP